MPRRDKLRIYGDLLTILYYQPSDENIVLTQIQVKANVPFDRLKKYISQLESLRLIEDETSLKLTQKGIKFVKMYNRVLDFMRQMGIEYR